MLCSLRSLLLAVIALSNCITWTASRHHFTHNVSGHRSRHRRQGTGLFLSASYVLPEGEGSGWGDWGAVSPCSRTCGGGVASQKRICLQFGSDGQPQCTGGDTKYISCETQDCPAGAEDFRTTQCAYYNNESFRGIKYKWEPYTKAPNPCELNCMPHGERFYYRHKSKVVDGTRCNDDSFDVCVNGTCQPVGCDMMLGSNAREDKCRNCRGNGVNCHTTSGLLNTQDLRKGYNDMLLIPEGATSIYVMEVRPSNNYLALRAKNGTYYLNGDYHIDFPRSMVIAGAIWYYERSQQGFAAPDKLRCLGPTNEPLYLSLLLQDDNVGIEYEYSLPSELAPRPTKKYNWVHDNFTPCSVTCAGGFQTRNVTCRSSEELDIVDDGLCDEGLKPPTNQTCNTQACAAQWVEGPWSQCSKRCGKGGTRSREIRCEKIITSGFPSIVSDKECFDILGPKPELYQECNVNASCPTWFAGLWKPCNKLCGEGKQTRQVVCYQKNAGRIEVLGDDECIDEKPPVEQSCTLQLCDGVDWVLTDWSGCDTCLSTISTRVALCATKDHKVVNSSYCEYHPTPVLQKPCDVIPPCQVQWYATQWSKCSVECGKGVQTRQVFCGRFENEAVVIVNDSLCADLPKYNDTKPCEVPKEKCPSKWYASPWTACTKECGGGEQHRRVMCLRGNKPASDCSLDLVLDSSQICNDGPCNKDEMLPLNPNSTPIMDDDMEDCINEDDYPEVGLDIATPDFKSTLGGKMFSDGPTIEEGSGMEFPVSIDLDSTVSFDDTGSGFELTSSIEDKLSVEGLTRETSDTSDTDTTETTDVNTFTTESTVTEENLTTDSNTTDTDYDSTDYSTTNDTSEATSETGSTESSETDETSLSGSSSSTQTDETSESPTATGSGSTETLITEVKHSKKKTTLTSKSLITSDRGETKKTTVSAPTNESTVIYSSKETSETESTTSSITDETGSTSSTETDETSDFTTETGSDVTETSVTDVTDLEENTTLSSKSLITSDREETKKTTVPPPTNESTVIDSSTETSETESTASSITDETGSTSSTETDETSDLTTETESDVTDITEVTDLKKKVTALSSESAITPDRDETKKTTVPPPTNESTVIYSIKETTETESTASSITDETGLTSSTETDETSDFTTETGSDVTEKSITEVTNLSTLSSESVTTSDKDVTTKSTISPPTKESTVFDSSEESSETEATASSITDETGSTLATKSDETSELGDTQSTTETESNATEPSATTTIIDMKSSKFGSSEISSITESTESTVRNETEPITTEKSTELKLTYETSEASPTLSSIAKVTEETVSSTTEPSPGKSAETKEESKEPSSTTEVSIVNATSSEKTSRSVPMEETTESVSGSTEPLTEKTTESSFVTATSSEKTSRSVSTEETTESVSGSTEPLTEKTTEAEAKSIEPNSTIETSTVAATTMETGSSSEVTQSTISELFTSEEASETASTVSLFSESVSSTIESSSTSSLEETTESTASSSSSESTSEFTEATTLPTEISGEGRTEQTSPTTEGTTLPTQTQETSETTSGAPVQGSSEKTTEVLPTEVTPVGTTIRDWKITMLITKPICKKRKVHCSKFKFGCCPDRKTAAAGPFDEGCPKPETCKESHYGCCPDEISPALGSKYEGCPIMPCAESLFGCCLSDNKTSAEGNDQEGCPPKPPACKSTKYGCCDDGETEATGPGNLGCPEYSMTTQTNADTETTSQKETMVTETSSTLAEGCAGTAFGCCFDNVTEALGPDGQGCPCNVTTFGCCPDGVSPANGTQMEGCLASCNTSSFGCCPDGKTPAHGHGQEGCCLLYPFGCCPDNYKPAEGPHLEGCGCQYARFGCCPDNVTYARGPNNEGCGCQYSTHGCCPDRHTEASGPSFEGCGCHTYQFGCCPDGFTIAKGTGLRGCLCHESKYGCCGDGETVASGPEKQGCDCSSSKYGCCPDGITEAKGSKFLGCTDIPLNRQAACSLSTDRGSCRNYSVHWYYDLEYGGCSRFWYGGCEGNGNRFTSKEECEDVCVQPSPQDTCKLPKVKGACTGYNVRWYYDSEREQCSQFVFGGCLGNANNFDSRELCQTQCEPTKTADQCNLPIDRGSCSGNFGRWGFNAETRRCEQFIWGGCEGNSNRFGSEAACVQRCDPPGTPKPQCTQPQDVGNCTDKEAMWSFSQSENRCVPFYYTGCGGNDNRFDNEQNCIDACPSSYIPDLCTLPSETGDCANYRERWYFDTSEERCRQFYYGGCGGNSNNFASQIECENRCTDFTPTTTTVQPPELRSHEAENISASCLLEKDPGPCTQMSTRWAYDYTIGKCAHFQYGGCGGNVNNFPSEETCEYYCKPVQDICQLPMLSGPCDDSIMRWFYDASIDACNQFTYGGCQGNDNRFETRDDCERRCRSGPPASEAQTTTSTTTSAPSTTVKVNIQNRLKEGKAPKACTISLELEECTRAGMVWYYDAERFECVAYENNDTGKVCRYTGVFSSEEACQRSCGAFRNINVCRYSLDPGPCQNFVSKYYFNQTSGICHKFAYGGCHGGPNRFSSFDECLQVCRPEMDPCKQGPEPGNCQTRFEMWYYDYYSDSCSRFTYTGCGGNDNRFETREDCEGRCRQRPAVITTTTTTIEVAHTTTTTVAPTYTVEPKAAECLTPDSLTPCGMNITAFYYDSARKVCVESDIGACRYSNSYRSEEECERKCGAFKDINVCEARLDTGPCRNSISKFYWDFASGRCQPYAYGGCGGGANRFSTIEECEEVCGSTGPGSNDVLPACSVYTNECSRMHCAYGIEQRRDSEGCVRCSCKAPEVDCEQMRLECETLRCPYGIQRITDENRCQRCICHEDPCLGNNCTVGQQCVAIAYRDPVTQEPHYSAQCRLITPEPPNCDRFIDECSRLQCGELGVQRVRNVDGCDRCSCVPLQIDCEPLRHECEKLKCTYGMDRQTGSDGCERCRCTGPPCDNKECSEGDRCVTVPYRDPITRDTRYSAECRTVNKTGYCPVREDSLAAGSCRRHCNDDADCRGIAKCCRRGCSQLCLEPDQATPPTASLPYTTTHRPDLPESPRVNLETEPEVTGTEGGKAVLRCLFHGNPPPKITWTRGEITIDADEGRYRLLSDGALEIVSLYRNDSGVYICIADNGLGTARQEVHLQVKDPVKSAMSIAGEPNAVLTGELGRPLVIRCLVYGYPPPTVYWLRGLNGPMIPFSSSLYEIRLPGVLLIRRLTVETVGEYLCQAYNGIGRPATKLFVVRAYQTDDSPYISKYIVPRERVESETVRVRVIDAGTERITTHTEGTTTTTTTTTTLTTPEPDIEFEKPVFHVAVRTHISAPQTTLTAGSELSLPCEVDGYPDPEVYWTKDNVRLVARDNLWISGTSISRLTIPHLSVSDSGVYGCHAGNAYSSHYSTVQINVQGLTIPAKCTDNPFFANCHLIVRSKFCQHKYYSVFCCKSCMEAGQLNPDDVDVQGDQAWAKAK